MSQEDQPPRLFPTSLDTHETSYGDGVEKTIRAARERRAAKAWDEKSGSAALPLQPASPIETSFRHSGWAATRTKVFAAMEMNEESKSARERFANCGASCTVAVALDGQSAKLSARYCRHRFCVPCMKARARVIKDNLLKWCDGLDPLMITLTMRPMDKPIGVILSHLLKSFARLREDEGWRRKIDAGAYCVEITRGEKGDHWHVHLHAICIGGYYPQNELSAAWGRASRGSTIIHVTRASTAKRGIEYAAEYASKGWSSECLESADLVCELLDGLRSRRLLGTFGGWRGRGVENEPVESVGFKHVGSLLEIVKYAARGERWAVGICRLIGVAVVSDGQSVSFVRSKRFPNPREELAGAEPRGAIPRGHEPS